MNARRVIDVCLGSDGETVPGMIGAVAARLGVELSVTGSAAKRTTIGDLALPVDPAEWWIEAAFLRALAPDHILFLCVANSARSQLAEGIARNEAGGRTRISSAGSVPTAVRAQAVTVLEEIGIDASGHTSKGVDDVERPVDAVITLCAEEVCPVWLEAEWRLHWGLPDPAAIEGSDEEKLDAFRAVRGELVERLGVVLGSA